MLALSGLQNAPPQSLLLQQNGTHTSAPLAQCRPRWQKGPTNLLQL